MEFSEILIPVAIFAGLGILLGIALAVASRVFAVKTDPRTEHIRDLLPGANCGGCGYSGCSALAEAIVKGEAPANACRSCTAASLAAIGKEMGMEVTSLAPVVATVLCSGTCDVAKKKYSYEGPADCLSANRMGGGDKECPNGCIGLGTCVKVCKYGAISVVNGVAVVDHEKCTGCGACANICPKHLIVLSPKSAKYRVICSSQEAPKLTVKECSAGCIACHACEKVCSTGSVTVNGNLASINYDTCISCGACAQKCPRKIIQ